MYFVEPSFKIISEDFTRENVLNRIELAARLCYKSEDRICEGSAERMVTSLIQRNHTAMIEHAPNLSVQFVCNRAIANELVRHRILSFAQESTRYVNYAKRGLTFVISDWIPSEDRKLLLNTDINHTNGLKNKYVNHNTWIYVSNLLSAEYAYNYFISQFDGTPALRPEEARDVLPLATKTEIIATGNVREWRHVFDLRCAPNAHSQIKEIMVPLILKLNSDIPEVWNDIVEKYDLTHWMPKYLETKE